jgi:amino acid adenylation domain-containing protein/non-ribosomal peptide synthase protein (TIGR01720 family)
MRVAGLGDSNRSFAYLGQTNYPVTVIAYGDDELLLRIEYDPRRLEEATIARMLGHLRSLLMGLAQPGTRTLDAIPLLPAAEREALLRPRSRPVLRAESPVPLDGAATLHELFAAQAALHPDATALTCEGQALTYAALNERANRLARELQRRGAGPEVLVGLYLPRSADLVVGILAILKAGSGYLPVDLAYPGERIAFMLEDSQAPLLLSDREHVASLPATTAQVLCIEDILAAAPTADAGTDMQGVAGPDDLAYVIYTSGTTGKPKGTMITHRNVVRLFAATDPWFTFGTGDVWTLFHSCAFDFSVWEIWGALIYGGRLVVVPFLVSRSPDAFYELLSAERVTVLNQTPSAFRQLIQAEQEVGERPIALRYVIFGGEALEMQSLRPWFDRHGDSAPRLVNMYGITETTVHVTWRPLSAGDVEGGSVIGEPIPDLTLLILDPRGEPAPIGVPGEIHVGGPGLSRGYLRRPELTAAKFVEDRLTGQAGARLYRTGDLARYLPSGDVEYLGRIDDQVKIRGFRIELGEIESALARHPRIRETCVMARQDGLENKRLVAYLVCDPPAPEVGELREHLKRTLPDYMIPAAFVFLERLPLTAHGKIDRKALPAPVGMQRDPARDYMPPATPTEIRLAAIWERVLRLERVSAADNFFELGGDSILIIQVVSLARQQGLIISPRLVFANPTITALAAAAKQTDAAADSATHAAPQGPVPTTPVQQWFFEQNLENAAYYNQAFMFALAQPLDAAVLQRALSALANRHDALRLRFSADTAGVWHQTARPTGADTPALEFHDLRAVGDARLGARITALATDVQSRLDFISGPLWRVAQFDCGARGARLLIAVHHLIVDGVSWRILVEDLDALYRREAGAAPGTGVSLPATTSSFLAWAHHLHGEATATFRDERGYWQQLAATGTQPLPEDFNHGANTEASTADVTIALESPDTLALLQRAPAAYNTQINDLLLTALARAFSQWTGRDDLTLSLEGHGREDLFEGLDLSHSIGWFTSIFPVHLALAAGDDLGAQLCNIKEQLRRVPRRGIGFGICRYLLRDPALAGMADPQVVFNYLGQLDQIVAASTLFSIAGERTGPWHGPEQQRRHLLEIDAQVLHGRLEVNFRYSRNRHSAATVERLAQSFRGSLLAIVGHCTTAGVGHATPADFPASGLDQAGLNRVTQGDRGIEDIYPLAPMQSLFLTAASAGGQVIDQWICDFVGPLNTVALREAWNLVLQRHAALRTTFFADSPGGPVQRVHRAVTAPWTIEDTRAQPTATRQQQWLDALQQERSRLAALSTVPLSRFLLVRTEDARWKFAWTVPALLLDGWSWPLVFRDLSQAYAALRAGSTPGFAAPRPYRDYVQWMQKLDLRDAQAFWQQRLQGLTEPTPLAGGAEAAAASQRYAQLFASADPQRGTRVAEAARAAQVTVNTYVQAAWGLVLARLSGRQDVLFGASVAGRPTELNGIEGTVGVFTNNIPVRITLADDDTSRSLVTRGHQLLAQTAEHQLAPLERIQSWSAIPWHQRMFDSLLVVQNYQVDASARRLGADIAIDAFSGPIHSSFPLLVLVEPGTERFSSFIYDSRELAQSTVQTWLDDFCTALDALVGNPDIAITALLATLSAPARNAAPRKARTRALHIAAPQTALESQILKVWQETLGLESLSVEENLLDLGVQSLLVIRLHHRLRDVLQRDFSVVTMFQYPTIRALADHLTEPQKTRADDASLSDRAQRQRQAMSRMKSRPGSTQGR